MGFYLSDNEAGVAFISPEKISFQPFFKYLWGKIKKRGFHL
jgi:hypothetical protein